MFEKTGIMEIGQVIIRGDCIADLLQTARWELALAWPVVMYCVRNLPSDHLMWWRLLIDQ